MQYEIILLLKYASNFSYIQVWFKCEPPPLFFLIKAIAYRKTLCRKKFFFSIDYVKINELYVLRTSYAIWVDEIREVIRYIKQINKNLNIFKKYICFINQNNGPTIPLNMPWKLSNLTT